MLENCDERLKKNLKNYRLSVARKKNRRNF